MHDEHFDSGSSHGNGLHVKSAEEFQTQPSPPWLVHSYKERHDAHSLVGVQVAAEDEFKQDEEEDVL